MAHATFVKSAQKDYPEQGIKKGESYYWWSFRFGGKHYSKTPPRPSQLINSPFLSAVAEIEERIGEFSLAEGDDVASCIEDIKSDIENLRDDTQGSFDNMPEGLQQGDTGQLLQGRIDGLEEMLSSFDSIDTDIEEGLKGDDLRTRLDEIVDDVQAISYGGE